MSRWLDTLRPASFRGVAFNIDAGDTDLGRRVVTHAYPLRDQPAHEDQGRKVRTVTVEAILIGDDVIAQLRALETALETHGPGRLVHPLYGELQVVVTSARARWSTKEGRVARIDIAFQEAGSLQYPSTAIDTAGAVDAAADAALDAAEGEFGPTFSTDGAPDFVVDRAIATVRSLASGASTALRLYGQAQATAGGSLGALLGALDGTAAADLVDSLALGRRTLDLFRQIAALAPGAAVGDALLSMAGPTGLGADLSAVAPTTASRRRDAANQDALITLVRVGAAVEAARAGTVTAWDSHDAALTWRDRAVESLDHAGDRAAEAGWDATWRTATDLRSAVVRDVATRAAPLPRLGTIRPAETLPSTLIAYQLDGDDLAGLLDRAADLGRRNRLRHPGFVPGGRVLEVLFPGGANV